MRTRRNAQRRLRASRIFPIRITLVAVMGLALAGLGGRAFDDFIGVLLLSPIAVALVAWLLRRRPIVTRVALEFATLLVTVAIAGTISGAARGDLVAEAIAGPQRLFTSEWPSPHDAGVVMAIALLVGLVTAVAADLAGRPRFHLAPLAPIVVGFACVMAIAAPVHPVRWVLGVLTLAAIVLVLARPGDDPRTRFRLLVAERSLLATLIGIVAAGVLASSAIAWTDRADPRRDVEADITLSLLDPVEQSVALRAAEPEFDVFAITDRSALIAPSLPTRWRLSALDEYDGQRWLPAITLRPIGTRLAQPSPPTPGLAPPIRYELVARSDDIDLVPLPGRPLEIELDGNSIETDADRTVVRLADAPAVGERMIVTSEIAPTAAAADPALVAPRQIDEIASTFTDTALTLGVGEGPYEQLRSIEAAMRSENWSLDPKAAGAGQQFHLIDRFINDTKRGTEEQFVTAFVLLARSLGVDARVATGFVVPPAELSSPLVLRSSYASVWPEVRLTGVGWLAFDPVPPEEFVGGDEPSIPPTEQSPGAAQPPVDPQPDRTDDEELPEPDEPIVISRSALKTWLIRGGLATGGALLPVVVALGSILLIKARRRRRRLRAPDPGQRIVGAWANATDALVDAGLTIVPSWTDDRIAEHATTVTSGVPPEVHQLALSATEVTFGAIDVDDTRAAEAITTSQSVTAAIRTDRSRWQRVRWRLSTRSLRRSTRSPVAS